MGASILSRHVAEASRSTGLVVLPGVAILYGLLGVLYLVASPFEPGWPIAVTTLAGACGYLVLFASLRSARMRLVHPIILASAIIGVAVALSFVSVTGDPAQTVVLIMTLLAVSYCLFALWTALVTVVLAAAAWVLLARDYPTAALVHWGLNMGGTVVLAVIISAARRRAIAARATVEEGLRESEERHSLVVDTALDAVITIDAAGAIQAWNPQAERVFGWSRVEAVGRQIDQLLIPADERAAHRAGIRRFLETGRTRMLNRRIEVTARARDGRELPVELAIVPIRGGGAVRFTAFVRDITERRQAEEALHGAKAVAEAATRAKSDFLAIMSHEIRTPLQGIFGMTELALDTDVEADRRDYLERVRACAESLMTIINDILDFSRIEAGKLEIERVSFEPRAILAGVRDTLIHEAERRGLRLECRVDERLPARVVGAPDRLRQVLLNLGSNALKFTARGEVRIELAPAAGAGGGPPLLRAIVRDTGIGIPADKQRLIFEAFTQADGTTTRRFGGTGLGLAISQRLVALMGGTIGVESAPGRGSTFWFTVPLAAPAAAADDALARRRGAGAPLAARCRPTDRGRGA